MRYINIKSFEENTFKLLFLIIFLFLYLSGHPPSTIHHMTIGRPSASYLGDRGSGKMLEIQTFIWTSLWHLGNLLAQKSPSPRLVLIATHC